MRREILYLLYFTVIPTRGRDLCRILKRSLISFEMTVRAEAIESDPSPWVGVGALDKERLVDLRFRFSEIAETVRSSKGNVHRAMPKDEPSRAGGSQLGNATIGMWEL
ncbi:hypothetical protein A3841_12875 [Pontibacter flavimaris]|uniref:Uncharacterized protein n=1 Tax=Pontibacter flavimaris TaxID=1797110 RepID=A0A1Q5PER4_9BACT|nr:hypothetical protein A3841_12875 [Pontibacter flavimaris]